MKTIVTIIIASLLTSACTGNKFLTRKYTAGFYNESHKTVKHNTIKSETEISYASLKSTVELKKANNIEEIQTEKEIINAKINSITKKDSIIHIKRKGKDAVIIVKNNLPNVHVIIDENHQTVPENLKTIDHDKIRKHNEEKIKANTIAAAALCLIPVVGFVIALTTKRMIRKYQQKYNSSNCNSYNTTANIALFISIIPTILFIALISFMILALLTF